METIRKQMPQEVKAGVRSSAEETKSVVQQLRDIAKAGATEEELVAFANRRLEEIIRESEPKRFDIFSQPREGFIHPDSKLVMNMLFTPEGFRVDDDSIYHEVVKRFVELARKMPEANDRTLAFNAVSRAIYEYYGLPLLRKNSLRDLMELYSEHSIIDFEAGKEETPLSMRELKGMSTAHCMEQGATAHNLMAFLGIDSRLVTTPELVFKEETYGHVYLLLHNEDKYLLYDPVNPFLHLDKEGKIVKVSFGKYDLTKEEYETLLDGGQVKVEHLTYDEGHNVTKREPMVYSGPTPLSKSMLRPA